MSTSHPPERARHLSLSAVLPVSEGKIISTASAVDRKHPKDNPKKPKKHFATNLF